MWHLTQRPLGELDLTTPVKIGKFSVPAVLLVLGGAALYYKLFVQSDSKGSGAGENEPDVPPATGDCANIDNLLYTPKGCGTVKATGYSKGSPYRIQLSELPLQPGFYAQSYPTNAWAAFQRLYNAANKAGFTLKVNSSFRTMARQIKFRKDNCTPGLPTGRFIPCKPLTAQAGFSNHQEGTAFDIQVGPQGSSVWNWLRANAGRYGFIDNGGTFGKKGYEPWHWTYKRELDQMGGG
jgi:hypothetical protein